MVLVPGWLAAQSCPPADGAPGTAGELLDCTHAEPASLPPDGPALGLGNPVNLVSGRKYERRVDIVLPDTARLPGAGADLARIFALQPGLPLVFSRHFTADELDRGLGRGWRHGFDTRLAFRGGERPLVEILQADGLRLSFSHEAEGRFVAARAHAGIVQALAEGFEWRWPDGRRLRFDDHGLLVRVEATNGDRFELRYEGRRLLEVRDRGGRSLRLRWRDGRLRAVDAPGGRQVVFGFDRIGRLASARTGDALPERYWYEDEGNPWRLTGSGTHAVARSHFAYDADGRVISSRVVGASPEEGLHIAYEQATDGSSGVTRVRGAHGQAQYHWQRFGADRIARLVQGAGSSCWRCPPTGVGWTWDESGQLVDDGFVHLQRDEHGRILVVERSPRLQVLASVEVPGVDGQPSTRHLLAPAATRSAEAGRSTDIREEAAAPDDSTPGEQPLELRRYGSSHSALPREVRQPSVAPGRERRARIETDERGRIVALDEQGWAPDGTPLARKVRLYYHDAADAVQPALAGRLVAVERLDPVDAARVLARTELRYDARGWLVGAFIEDEPLYTIVRDAAGGPVPSHPRRASSAASVAAPGMAASTLAGLGPARLSPELASALLQSSARTQPRTLVLSRPAERARIDAAGRISREFYDDLGRLVRQDDPRTGFVIYRHDALDRLVGIEWQDGTRWHLRRDRRGRPVEILRERGSERDLARIHWQGEHIVRIEHPTQSSHATYDPAGRLLRLEHEQAGSRYRQSFEYDPAGRLLVHRLADGSELRHEYDPDGRPRAMYWRAPGGAEELVVGDARYARGRIVSFRLGKQVRHERAFDAQGRLASIVWAGHRAYPGWRYHWRREGLLDGIDTREDSRRFVWDRAGRLLIDARRHADGQVTEQYFAWNAAGDLLGSRDAAGQTQRHALPGGGARGGLPATHGRLQLEYGAQRRIHRVHSSDGAVAQYRYNALGERVERRLGGERTGYLYHRRQLLAQTDARGRLQRSWLHWQGQVIGFLDHTPGAAPRLRFVLGDHLGAPAMVTDARGEPLWRGRIGAFGALLEEDDSAHIGLALRLPGQFADPETGLSDNYQRTYDPQAGRYLEPDPLGSAGDQNPYAYAGGNPLQHVDPLGLILFAFDGTGSTPESRTNVWLMAQQYASYDEYDHLAGINEHSFYEPGVGTTGGAGDNFLTGGVFALQLEAKVNRQLDRLDDYLRGRLSHFLDAGATIGPQSPLQFDLDVVGFSRGAAAARDFVNQVLRRRDAGYYRGLVGGDCVSLDIRFLGLFDTVLGVHVGEFELGIPAAVGHVASVVAANEHRRQFPLESILASRDAVAAAANRREVALPGAHADIGGGYACTAGVSCDGGDLSDIALLWMRREAESQGIVFEPLPEDQRVVSVPLMHDETTAFPFFDPDPRADRQVYYHASTQTEPDAAEPAVPAAPPQSSRESITDEIGISARRALEFVQPERIPRPGQAGRIDTARYAEWLRARLGLDVVFEPAPPNPAPGTGGDEALDEPGSPFTLSPA